MNEPDESRTFVLMIQQRVHFVKSAPVFFGYFQIMCKISTVFAMDMPYNKRERR